MRFAIRALDETKVEVLSLSIEALDEADALSQLRARQLTPMSVSAARHWGRSNTFSVTLFAQELHAMVHAGLSLMESLDTLAAKERVAATRAVTERLMSSLQEGQRFSAALRAQSGIFPPLFIGIVEAAESTGELPAALERYLDYSQRMQTVRQRVVSASIYPAILLVVGGLVALFLMGWVVPRFATVYQSTGRALPWGSQLLLDWGRFAGQNTGLLAILVVAVLLSLGWWVQSVARKADWSRVASWVPGVAGWLELLTLSRVFLTLSLLLRGGLPIQQALALAGSVLPPGRRHRVEQASGRIAEGQPLSLALEECGLSTAISLRFLRAGERSGQVAEMLHRAALYHDAETSRWVERFSKTFEPLLMAAIGLVIGVIVLLLYMPIFDLAGSLQ